MDRDEQISDPREEIITLISDEMGQIKRKMSEFKTNIEQAQMDVDREQGRYSGLATELRNIQDNLDTVPRQDIRTKYDEALDSRFRLATMRGQLEKFQANYEHLEREQVLLSQLMGRFNDNRDIIPDGDESVEVTPKSPANIVRIVQAQEEERQRLARQMHDGPAQSLTNFILQAEICQRLFNRNPDRAEEELDNLKTAASVTFQKVRDFIFDLRPMMLDDLGVVPTVRRYVDSFKEKTDIETELDITGDERRLENAREVMLFRSIQDLLGHVRDYANANHLLVRLDMSSNVIKAMVEDNGRGFNAEAVFSGEETNVDARVQGLITIRQKFELVGGAISVTSDETSGTAVRLELPTGD